MAQRHANWQRIARKWLWILTIIGVVAAVPLAAERFSTENSAKKVEFVFDYRDLLDIANYKADSRTFIAEQLEQMKHAGIHSLAVYESTLNELQESRRIELYSSHEAAALLQQPVPANEDFAYVLFTDPASAPLVKTFLQSAFESRQVKTHPWSFKNEPGLVIEMPLDNAQLVTLPPDPLTLKMLTDDGFHIVARLSNRLRFDEQYMDSVLSELENAGVKTIIPDGNAVPGYTDVKDPVPALKKMAELLNRHHMGLAAIELQKTPQKGFNTLAKETGYNVVRLHSFTENDADKLTPSMTPKQLDQAVQAAADQFVLAAKDRNIRMILLNAKPSKNTDKGAYVDPLAPLYQTLIGKDGALKRIQDDGFTLGQAHAFHFANPGWVKLLKPLVIIGSVALIALMLSYFIPELGLPVFLLGLIGSAGLYVLAHNMLYKLLALGTTVSAASLSLMLVILSIRRQMQPESRQLPLAARLGRSFLLFVLATVVSLMGAAFVVGLLNDITYNLLLDQFTGVKILAYLPILLVLVFVLFFSEGLSFGQIVEKAKRLLHAKISVLWIVTAGIVLGAGYYYLSRTGNEGQASSVELMFRSFLENTLKVRPRTKEFLIGHPLFLLGVYLCLKKRLNYVYLVIIGAVGQADVVGTFTHLHTPLLISAIRVVYGLVLGSVIGLAFIAVWEAIARSWRKWVPAADKPAPYES